MMHHRYLLPAALGLAVLAPSLADLVDLRAPTAYAEDESSVWVAGHFESRETRHPVPAEERREWIEPRYESVLIPAITERVRIPAVVENVRVMERVWVPERTERRWQHGFWDLSGWNPARWETRVVEPGHYDSRPTDRFEERVVAPERWETRVVTPERSERRLVADGFWRTVIVRPARVEVTVERVWIRGHWERR